GPAPGYDQATGDLVGNDFAGDNQGQAASFTVGSSARVGSLSLALSCFFCSSSDDLTISLNSDSSGLPGSAIETFTYSDSGLGNFGDPNPLVSLTSLTHPLLNAGTTYWLTVVDSAGNDAVVWNWNQTGDSSSTATSLDGGATWANAGLTPGAYQLNDVPEPASVMLLGSGL